MSVKHWLIQRSTNLSEKVSKEKRTDLTGLATSEARVKEKKETGVTKAAGQASEKTEQKKTKTKSVK